ncbi:MAG: hypothetical protein JHC98_10905 [Thermoleophilaceae bacterium]|nr:hypothetical protein [Thermoleophilaceae bacterium]
MIEFLFWEGCPSHERALSDLTALLDEYEIPRDRLRVTEVLTDADAQREHFIGSPTIRVNGTDIVDPGDSPFALDCRIYYRGDGKVSPLPDHDVVRAAIASYATNTTTGT